MADGKQTLLKRHRSRKRLGVAVVTLTIAFAGLLAWWLPLPLLILAWLVHEVWFADHQFYSPAQDYRWQFPAGSEAVGVTLRGDGSLLLDQPISLSATDTLFLALDVRSNLSGRLLDPAVILTADDLVDVQEFERNSHGLRYINLTGCAAAIAGAALRIVPRHCRLAGSGQLWVFRHPDYLGKRILVIAPHADDAELAAFGLYSSARESWLVTLTAGEVEAGHYRRMGFPPTEAALLKGRLRAWDSIAIPRWGGVPPQNCLQLGYFCLQLPVMQADPGKPAGSREGDLCDTLPFRVYNQLPLPGDADGLPTWKNLKADLLHILGQVRPDIIVVPHPDLDPHPDHVAAWHLVTEALAESSCHPEALLCYANHLHDNDRWPMGNAHCGVPLPPRFSGEVPGTPYCLVLAEPARHDKAMALGMMHDLQTPLPLKKRFRRRLQSIVTGRQWPPYGENEFFRKAVRRHELFWVRACLRQPRPGESCGHAGEM
jgi:LmbE family N-acetylglucosaminyl deacetylase